MHKRKNKLMTSSLDVSRIVQLTLLVLLFSSIFFSCKRETHFVERHYYPNGELLSEIPFRKKDSLKDGTYKEYYKNGNIKQIILLKAGKPVDSAMQYYESGELKFKEIRNSDTIYTNYYYKNGDVSVSSQFLNKEVPIEIGWSRIFTKYGNISDSLEYVNVDGASHLNQRIHYGKSERLNVDSSYYYNFKISKIRDTDKYRLEIDYEPSIKNAQIAMILGKDIDPDFSNLKDVELDTLIMEEGRLSTDNLKKPYRELKGFFYEYRAKVKDTVDNDSVRLTITERKTYFNDLVQVTDTVE